MALLHLFQRHCRRVRVRARRTPRVPPLLEGRLCFMLHLLQLHPYCSWMERHWCSERPSFSVWVAVEETVASVSQSHRESAPQIGSSVCAATERVAMTANLVPLCCSTEPLGRTGRLSSEPADLAAALLAASFFGLGVCRPSLLAELLYCAPPPSWGAPIPTSARPPARCEVSCPFCRLRAPESAKAAPRLPCCTAEEAGHPVLKEIAL